MSGGRALLGLGSGDSAVFPLGWKPAPITDMRRFLPEVRRFLNGHEVTVDGRPVRLAGITRPVPIFVAASQPRMLTLAGEQADGVILLGAAAVALAGPADACRDRIEALLALNVDRITFTLLSGHRLERVRQLDASLAARLSR